MAEEDDCSEIEQIQLNSAAKEDTDPDELNPEFEKIDTRDRKIEREVDPFGYDWDILNLNYLKESNFKEIYNFVEFDGLVDIDSMNEVLIRSTLKHESQDLLSVKLCPEEPVESQNLYKDKGDQTIRSSTGDRMDIEHS